jgi:hypothetical protein
MSSVSQAEQTPAKYGVVITKKFYKDFKIEPTSRLFYGKFPYRIEYVSRHTYLTPQGDKEIYHQNRSKYFKNVEDMNAFIAEYSPRRTLHKFKVINVPISEKHMTALKSPNKDHLNKVVYRQTYFLREYKYCWELRREVTELQRNLLNEKYPELVVSSRNLFAKISLDDDMHVFLEVAGMRVKQVTEVILIEEVA